jgi:hypothetical protein
MKMRLVLLVVGLLMAGVLVAGCGDDEDSGGGGGETSAQTETGGGGGETTTPEEEGGGGSANPNAQQAVESCKQQIGAQPGISEDVKKDLEEICQKAASGDEKDVREATKEVCIKLIEENVPEGPAQDQAKASCEQATTAP